MDNHVEGYKFSDLSDTEKSEAYKAVLADLRKVNQVLETMIALSRAYPVH
jgi:hypothetical protein